MYLGEVVVSSGEVYKIFNGNRYHIGFVGDNETDRNSFAGCRDKGTRLLEIVSYGLCNASYNT